MGVFHRYISVITISYVGVVFPPHQMSFTVIYQVNSQISHLLSLISRKNMC